MPTRENYLPVFRLYWNGNGQVMHGQQIIGGQSLSQNARVQVVKEGQENLKTAGQTTFKNCWERMGTDGIRQKNMEKIERGLDPKRGYVLNMYLL